MIRTQKPIEGFALLKVPDIDLDQQSQWLWEKSAGKPNPFLGKNAQIEATNLDDKKGAAAASLTINWRLVPEFPEVAILPITTATLLLIVLLYTLFRLSIRRVAAVVSATMKEAIGQPIFSVAIIAGIVLLLTFIVIPYNTFGEDVKMLKDSGLTLVKILALLVVIWTASVTVSDEIEGRTALTVLSKPLTRRQFVVGKFIGLSLVALLIFMILGAVLMSTTSLKVVYDARESSKTAPLWADCATEMVTVVPGLVLSLLETILLAAVSLAVSTRVGMIPNLIICFTIYVLGHLVQSSVGKLAIVRFVGRLFATLLPVLEHFTIEAAVIGGVPVPWGYLAWAAVYAGLYSAIALLIALVLFQNRDLA
jgi:ABC-type transport system involved in multi-copper enzyme maturation permease subunit